MKKTLIYLAILFILNILGDVLINNFYSNYYKESGVINYIVIIVIAYIFYLGNLTGKKFLINFLFSLIFLFCSLIFVGLILLVEGFESLLEFLLTITSKISSLFELMNFFIDNIPNEILRKSVLLIFNSVGISILLFSIAFFTNFLATRLKIDKNKHSLPNLVDK